MSHPSVCVPWLVAALSLGLSACEGNVPVCGAGDLAVEGSIDTALTIYQRSCAGACWSFPFDDDCADACVPPMTFDGPNGLLLLDRRLMLTSPTGGSANSQYVFSFGYVDELGGTAPTGWGFLSEGPRSYLDNTLDGSARFVIELVETQVDPTTNLQAFTAVIPVTPGRLEILSVTDTRMSGRFFVGVDSPTKQQGGELLGCFDLAVGELIDSAYRLLTP